MRVTFCWSDVSGYMLSCWSALQEYPDVSLTILASSTGQPWGEKIRESVEFVRYLSEEDLRRTSFVRRLVVESSPDVVVVGGWWCRSYRQLALRGVSDGVKLVLAMDNPWVGSLRQVAACVVLRRYLRHFSCVVVPGERAWQYALRLGVREERLRRGLYGIDYEGFSAVWSKRVAASPSWPRRFLFVGRLTADKGLDVLLDAYQLYRGGVSEPWPLTVCGSGAEATRLAYQEGVNHYGFVQPPELRELMANHGALVLPSRYDPWPLVVVESCAAGLPIVCTEACGSAVELVRPYFNGLIVPTGHAESLAEALQWIHANADELPRMGSRSVALAEGYSAAAWAKRWWEYLSALGTVPKERTEGPDARW